MIFLAAITLLACGKSSTSDAPDASLAATTASSAPSSSPAPDAAAPAAADASSSPCPAGMAYVDTAYCPKLKRECADMEHEKPNNLEICHRYESGPGTCLVPEEHRQFCIDVYEYPNEKGAHPQWMTTWADAQATCESKGKRLCYASEWTAACEGPDHTPFPYGYKRDHDVCNIDNFFIDVRKDPKVGFVMFSKDPEVQKKELERLDQSVPSGSMEGCTSGFGVHDMTGNLDEWVTSDMPPADKSRWSAFKGGAWGHVRNACRPYTTSHYPHESYYFWGFRCCEDAAGAPVWRPCTKGPDCPEPPPEVEARDLYPDPVVVEHPAGPSKTKYGK